MTERRKTYCRICSAYCALNLEVAGNRITALAGDADDPVSRGYTCVKGRELPWQVHGPARLQHSLRRNDRGEFEPIDTRQALHEIAARLRAIVDRDGPCAVASFCGTAAYANPPTIAVGKAFHQALNSPSFFSTMTIDQPAKVVAIGRTGVWGGGQHTFTSSDVALSIGNNTIVSGLTLPGGPPGTNPSQSLREAIRRGLTLIVVDPRVSEVAALAHVHLQVRPGEDAALLAGMLHVILAENLHDAAFCTRHVAGLDELRAALAPFTPAHAAERAGVPVERLVEAARLFARGPRGGASSGTGPDMGPHACVTEHLMQCLNIVCGRFNREGEKIPNPGVLSDPLPRPGQAIPTDWLPTFFHVQKDVRSRVKPLYRVCDELPAATLPEEILTPGDGQVKALLCVGGNPALAVPNHTGMNRALDALELLVCVDINLSATARKAHYVIAARHPLEREDVTDFMDFFYDVPYAFYTRAVLEPEGDVIEDWEAYLQLAAGLGVDVALPGGTIKPGETLAKLDVLKLYKPSPRIGWDTLHRHTAGHVYDELDVTVAPAMEGMETRFQLMPEGMTGDLARIAAELPVEARLRDDGFTHQMICTRLPHAANSVGIDFPQLTERRGVNDARVHPADLAALGVADGDHVTISNRHGELRVPVRPDERLRPGVVSISQCWGGENGPGVNSNVLTGTADYFDPLTGMPLMTAVPVRLTAG